MDTTGNAFQQHFSKKSFPRMLHTRLETSKCTKRVGRVAVRIDSGGLPIQSDCTSIEKMYLITVITPVKNSARTLEKCIVSVLKQKSSTTQYIIVDGGSDDGTNEIIKTYESQIDIILSKQDNSLYDAINRAYKLASGQWSIVLGADDCLVEGCLEEVERNLTDKTAAYYGNVILESSGRVSAGRFTKYDTMYYNIPHQALFYPITYYRKNQYDLKYRIAADHVYLMKFINTENFQIHYMKLSVSFYNDISGVSSINQDLHFRRDQDLLVALYYPWFYIMIYKSKSLLIFVLRKVKVFDILKRMFRKLHPYKV